MKFNKGDIIESSYVSYYDKKILGIKNNMYRIRHVGTFIEEYYSAKYIEEHYTLKERKKSKVRRVV